MAYNVKMVYSENPFADIVIYYAKVLGLDTVLKMKDVADQNETEESLKNAERYIACMDNTMIYDLFEDFPEEVLIKSGLTGQALIIALMNPKKIPERLKETVFKNMKQWVIETYEEKNDYYRMLMGLPPMGYTGTYLPEETVLNIEYDYSKPIHLQSDEMIMYLDKQGILEEFYQEDTKNRGYIRYLDKKIPPYAARKASAFTPLYIPKIDATEVMDEYRDRLEINRRYAITTIYSEAYKYESDYFDNFVAVFILLNTMVDMISRIQEFIARRDVFDIRTCRYIFESYGVTFFPEIPLKYQIRMVKNLHTLLKYKSTAKCMVDICSLFGFENIKIFKYYLLRNRKSDGEGHYSFTGNAEEDYTFKFVKIPIDEPMDDYIRNPSYQMNYDEITLGDTSWDGGLRHEDVRYAHKELEFNYTRTKYYSIEVVYDLAKIAIQQAYFYNMLYDNVELEKLIMLNVPILSSKPLNVADIFTFLTALTYRYYRLSDNILDTSTKVLTVYGFNFKANLEELAALFDQYNHYRLYNTEESEALKLAFEKIRIAHQALMDFKCPTDQIPSFKQFMNIFRNNLDVRDVLVNGMRNADQKRMYDIYKTLYDSLMTIELTMDHFANPDTGELYRDVNGEATYTEYLRNAAPDLYYKLVEIDMMDDKNSKEQFIANLIDSATYVLEEWIDSDEFESIFHGLPVVSADAVKQYIKTIIDFYKSYKIHFLGVNTVYTFDDKWEGWIRIIDDFVLNRRFWKDDVIQMVDLIADQINTITKVDPVTIKERIYLDISTWRYYDFTDRCWIREDWSKWAKLPADDSIGVTDDHRRVWVVTIPDDKIPMLDIIGDRMTRLTLSDHIGPRDVAYIEGDDTPWGNR